MIWTIGLVVFWVVCGVIGYGTHLAYFQRQYTAMARECYYMDVIDSCICGILGPVGLLANYVALGFNHGIKWG